MNGIKITRGLLLGTFITSYAGLEQSLLNECLERAICMQNVEQVRGFLESNADPNYKNPRRSNIPQLIIAVYEKNVEIAELLLAYGADANEHYYFGGFKFTALLLVTPGMCDRSRRIAERLIAYGAEINSYEGERWFPLGVTKSREIISILLRHGAEINSCNSLHESALYLAVRDGSVERVSMLLAAKADPNIPDVCEESPLHIAANKGYEDIAQLLIEHGAHVDGVNVAGDSPLHCAVRNGQSHMQRLLISSGASADLTNNDGLTPLQIRPLLSFSDEIEFLDDDFEEEVLERD